jgi:uncharacterized membrane protein YbhN (UPF0104 family)
MPGHPPRRHRLAALPTPAIFAASVLVALAILWRRGALGDVAHAARDADAALLLAGGALYLASLALLAFRWHLVVVMVGGLPSILRATEAFLTSVVVNYAAPIGLAVPTRAALTKRALALTPAQTGAAALWEIGVDVLLLAIVSAAWIVLGLDDARDAAGQIAAPAVYLAAIAAAVAAATLAVFLVWRLRPALWGRLRFEALAFIRIPRDQPAAAVRVVVASASYWALQLVVFALLLAATGIDPTPRLVLGLIGVPILVGMLSPVPGGAGVREALMVAIAGVAGADPAAVLLAALVYRVALFAAIPILYAGVRLLLRRTQAQLRPTALD